MLRVRARLGLQRLSYLRLSRKLTSSVLLLLALFALLGLLPLNLSSDAALNELERTLHLLPRPTPKRTRPSFPPLVIPLPQPPPPPPIQQQVVQVAPQPPKKAPRPPLPPPGVIQDELGLDRYTRRPDGLLEVDIAAIGKGRHPIDLLIQEGKRLAKAHDARIPRTLDQAVKLYKKLNDGFSPPAGYDRWFKWCKENDVVPWPHQAAHKTMLPYLSIPGSILKERIKTQTDRGFTSIMAIKDGKVSKSEGNPGEAQYRKRDIFNLLTSIASILPDIEGMYFNLNDVPDHSITYGVRERSIALAKAGKVWPEEERKSIEERQDKWGWPTNCGPDSPLAKGAGRVAKPGVSKTFIWSQEPSMDHCLHPDLLKTHGTFIYGHPKSHPLNPLFSYSTAIGHADILMPSLDNFGWSMPAPDFRHKPTSLILWRGSTTGLLHSKKTAWKESQRSRLALMTDEEEGEVEVLVRTGDGGARVERLDRGEMNYEWFDVGFSNDPVSCDREDGTCDEMEDLFHFKDFITADEAGDFKFQLDVDGNGWSARYKRLLSSGSVVLKSTVYSEWISESLIPWYHYVPVQVDYSDLYDIAAYFFEGSKESRRDGPWEEAARIGDQGRRFVEERWRWGDVQGYMVLLLLEYARALADDREGATYMGS